MNKGNMRKLIWHLRELPPEKVYMDFFYSQRKINYVLSISSTQFDPDACGTAACIGGWAAALARKEGAVGPTVGLARDWLGLHWKEADGLFYGNWKPEGRTLESVTRDEVVEELERRLAAEEQDNGPA